MCAQGGVRGGARWCSSISTFANKIVKTHFYLTSTTMCRPIVTCTPRHFLSNAHGHLTGCHSCQSTPRHTAVSRRPRLQIQMDSFSCLRRNLKAQRLLDAVLQAPEIIETDATRALHSLQHLQQTGAFSTDPVHCFVFAQGGARGGARGVPHFPLLPTKSQKSILILASTAMCRPIVGCTPRHLLSNAHGRLTGCHSCQSTARHTAVSRRPRLQIQMDSFSCPRRSLKAQRLLDAVLQAPEIIETDATRALHSLQHLQQTGAFSTDPVHCFMFAQGGARGCVVFLTFHVCQQNRKNPF